MLNIIRQDCLFNQQLTRYPPANANVAIFGTQSSGKSTLLNHTFGTKFPVLDTSITRQRCTKGVWLHNLNNFNVIDTQGFDSEERDSHERIFQKQEALFCLALSDILIINMWMDQIGRYQASHSHVLKSIIKASEKLIAKQQRKIVFVVRDCTDDADRNILRQQLNSQMMAIVKAETKKSTLRFSLDYFMMSHYYDAQKQFKKQAKDLNKFLSNTRKSNLSNYTDEDRLIYIKNLWQKVTSDDQVDLRSVEDALRNYALERVKRQTISYMEEWLESIDNLEQFRSYQRFKQTIARKARVRFMQTRPIHVKEQEAEPFIEAIFQNIESRQNKHFMTVLLPEQQDRLIREQYKKKVDLQKDSDVMYFKRNMQRRKDQVVETYNYLVKGLRQHAKMKRRFNQKVKAANEQYEQYLQHLQTVFKIQLQKALNEQVDNQTKQLSFDGSKIQKIITIFEQKHKAEIGSQLSEMWQRIVQRTTNSTIVDRIKSQGERFSTAGIGALVNNQTSDIVSFYHQLQDSAEKYIENISSFMTAEEQTTTTLQKVDNIRKLINSLIQSKISEDSRKFKITIIFVTFLMYFFYGEFKLFMRVMGVGKKRMRNWTWLYIIAMAAMVGIAIFQKRKYFKGLIQQAMN